MYTGCFLHKKNKNKIKATILIDTHFLITMQIDAQNCCAIKLIGAGTETGIEKEQERGSTNTSSRGV